MPRSRTNGAGVPPSGNGAPPRFRRTPLFTSLVLALAAPATVLGQSAPSQPRDTTLPEVNVRAETPALETPALSKITATPLNTPQTITIVPQVLMEQQNLLSLQQVLSTVPGITFGAGEGGGGYGDSITIRGFTGSSDVFVDGLRDAAQYTRSDMFNIQQVEVYNGADSVYFGVGSVGGAINLVSKVPLRENFVRLQGGLGTDDFYRGTADVNQTFGAERNTALRVNLMGHHNDVPGRDFEKYERYGVAPSVSFGLGTPTRATLSYVYQHDDNVPQYGVPFYNGRPLHEVDPSSYFGYHNIDNQKIDVNTVTLLLEHDINANVTVRNQTRYGEIKQFSLVNPPQGTWCLDSTGLTPLDASCGTVPPGFYQPSGPRGTTRDSKNTGFFNDTVFLAKFVTGPVGHDLAAGFTFSRETFSLNSGNSLRNPGGTLPNPTLPLMEIGSPNSEWTGPVNFVTTATQDGDLDNQAVYAFDTMKLAPQWDLNAGIRWEHNKGSNSSTTVAQPGGAVTQNPTFSNDADLFSYRAGIVFKPAPNGSIYFSFANAETPSKASVNGSCTAQTCDVDPEKAINYEFGTKWLFLNNALSVTAAIFRNERQNYRVADPGNPDNPSGIQQLDGKARVDGFLLGVSGRITPEWAVFLNYAYLNSEVLQGASNFVSSQGQDYTKGDPLTQTPQNSGSFWTTYDLPRGFQVGYGATYQGPMYLTQHSAANPSGPLIQSEGYWVHNAMATWQATSKLALQLNVTNLFDKEYYTRLRNNGWAVPGNTRAFVLTAAYTF